MIEALKLVWNKLSATVLTIIALVVGGLVLFFSGKSKGKEEAMAKQNEETLKTGLEIKNDDANRDGDDMSTVNERLKPYIRK